MILALFSLIGSYLKMILRVFSRNGSYKLLNLCGLALGFTIFIFSAIYVYFETSFESFHEKAANIYRATYRYTPGEGYVSHWARVPFDYINNLPADVPGVKSLVRFQNHARKYVRVGADKFRPDHAYVADKEVFDVFSFKLIAGDPSTALASPNSIVITETVARKYFGDADPMGKEMFVIGDLDNAETLHHVTGVMKDLPANTHLPVEMLISFKDQSERTGWAYTYILVDNRKSINEIQEQMPAFIRKYTAADLAKSDEIIFQPLSDIHLQSTLARELVPGGKMFYVKIVGFAGLFILLIAVINFMNLNSAMSLGRAKEIGMRKILGATKGNLVSYLLLESLFSNVLALMIAGVIVYLIFPMFQQLAPVTFVLPVWKFSTALICLAMLCGLVCGAYPVMLLTSMSPASVVKTSRAVSMIGREGVFSLKRVMVTLQFCISIILLGSALVAYQQFRYLKEKDLGIRGEQVLAIPGLPDNVKAAYSKFKDELLLQRGIAGVTACMEVPSREIRDAGPVLVEGINADPAKAPVMDIQLIDQDFAAIMGLEFLAGGNILPGPAFAVPEFTPEFTIQKYLSEQPHEYLINETAMRQLGWKLPEEAIGQRISWSIGGMALSAGPIRGVVRDFHQESLKNKVDPVVMVYEPVWLRTFLIKVEASRVPETLATIQKTWDKLFPLYPLEYHFLDELYDSLYKGERVQLQLMFVFSILAIVIAFIGLVGLMAYTLKTRMKELAIRKVLGATIRNLTEMMSREYIAVLLIGGAVAVPVSVYGVNQWLAGFAYHVDISPWIYVFTVLVIVFLLLITVSIQTLRTSRANPAQTLREE
jgi:putative ABC transport system permease protein